MKNLIEKINEYGNVPLTTRIIDVRLIPAVKVGICSQIEGWNWRFRLESLDVDIVLHVHL